MVPTPVQAAARAALDDDGHVLAQRSRYGHRRELLRDALDAAGFQVVHSEAGLYLWCTRGEPAMRSVDWFAERGILVTPGTVYGPAGGEPRPGRAHRLRRAGRLRGRPAGEEVPPEVRRSDRARWPIERGRRDDGFLMDLHGCLRGSTLLVLTGR